jgi:hypothetical protein
MNRFNILKEASISIPVERVREIPNVPPSVELTAPCIPGLTLVQPPNFYCPQCGTHSQNSINIHFGYDGGGLNGDYCVTCLAQWINRNVPKLIRQ